ncbi:hypothetical protein GWI33_021564 [Rhynchophorus ferrugineus]|uniref:Uncharacterized protein n=1 Tax=Rhynchophorus ferrugineus TaxID=354439 RepID=A0A834MJJ4_RHYFE|nr:hypothetical protein GWI33_021564 [Rhynchophorus ferrugineus]
MIPVKIRKLCETLSGPGNTDGNSLWRQRTFPEKTWAIEARAYTVPPDVATLLHQHVTETTVEAHERHNKSASIITTIRSAAQAERCEPPFDMIFATANATFKNMFHGRHTYY